MVVSIYLTLKVFPRARCRLNNYVFIFICIARSMTTKLLHFLMEFLHTWSNHFIQLYISAFLNKFNIFRQWCVFKTVVFRQFVYLPAFCGTSDPRRRHVLCGPMISWHRTKILIIGECHVTNVGKVCRDRGQDVRFECVNIILLYTVSLKCVAVGRQHRLHELFKTCFWRASISSSFTQSV